MNEIGDKLKRVVNSVYAADMSDEDRVNILNEIKLVINEIYGVE